MKTRVMLLLAAGGIVIRAIAGLWAPLAMVTSPFLVVTVLAALPGRLQRAFWAAIVTGVLADAWTGRWYGEFTFVHLLIAFTLAMIARWVDLVQFFPAALSLAAATAAAWGIDIALVSAFDHPVGELPGPALWLAAMVVNTVIGLFAWRLARERKGFDE